MVVNDEPAFLAWFLGGLRSGVVPVPLSTMLTADDLAAIVADAGAGVVVVSADYAGHLPTIAERRAASCAPRSCIGDRRPADDVGVPVARVVVVRPTPTEAPVAATTRRLARRSGSTARARPACPKGVMHRHANPQATAETYAALGARHRRPTTGACRWPSCSSPTASATR